MNEADKRYRQQRLAEINEDIKKLQDERIKLMFSDDEELLFQCRALKHYSQAIAAIHLYRTKTGSSLVDAAAAIRAL